MRRITFRAIWAAALAACLAGCGDQRGATGTGADQTAGIEKFEPADEPQRTAARNSDRRAATNGLVSGDQANNEADRELARKIRREIAGSDRLSPAAKGIRIQVAYGKVTLRGAVKTTGERNQLASIARNRGATWVDNRLQVRPIGGVQPAGE